MTLGRGTSEVLFPSSLAAATDKEGQAEVEKHPWKTLGRGQRENSRIPTESETRMRLPHVEENPTGKRASGSSWEAAYWAAKGQGLG